MVVVEGVARSLNPHINIWQVAQPIVEGYIKENLGPRAMLRDLMRTAKVLGRFGPKLPRMVEAQLVRQVEPVAPQQVRGQLHPLVWMVAGAVLTGVGIWIGTVL
ncbi:putative protein kinase UbiB [mine drainage metagenome]|uniref:Ubiquinone biosynthesis protein UbiB n=1 Tax=mine drainage metagenome TaxID=410659 RepID=A0A1J5PP28_9ZZZZ